MPPSGTPAETPRTSPLTRTYDDLVNQIHDLSGRPADAPALTLAEVPNPEAARALAVGRSHDSLTVLASQVRQLQDRQAARSDVSLELGALHDAIISQTHNRPEINTAANFAREGMQGLGRFGERLLNPNNNVSVGNRLLDGTVAAVGAAALGTAMLKLWNLGNGQRDPTNPSRRINQWPAWIRFLMKPIKALAITGGTLGAGWLAMRYVDSRVQSDEVNLDNPDRRGATATALNTRNQALGEIRAADTRTNLRGVELTALSLPIRMPSGKLLRFVTNGSAALVRRQTVAAGTNALTESIQMQVDAIHTDANGEFVVKQGAKTIYVPAADFYSAVEGAALGTPMVLGGFNNPRAMTGRSPDSITVNWQVTP